MSGPRRIASSREAEALVGQVLGVSEPLMIDQGRIDAFAEATGDRQWIHVDPVRAADGPFGGTIAHGYLTLSLLPVMAAQTYALDFGAARLNYGVNRVRFITPVRAGSTVRAHASFQDVRRGEAGTYITTSFTVSVEDETKPACVAETIVLVVGGDGAASPEMQREG